MMSSHLLSTRALVGLRPRSLAIQPISLKKTYATFNKFKKPRMAPTKRARAEAAREKKLKEIMAWASYNKWKIIPDGDDGLPRLQAVPKAENQMPPFEFEIVRRFNRLKIGSSLAEWKADESPHIKSIKALPTEAVHDVYYDTPDRRLFSRRVLVRQRNGKWQAKTKLPKPGTDVINEQWQHHNTSKQIGNLVHSRVYVHSGRLCPKLPDLIIWHAWQRANWGLDVLADFHTERHGWAVECVIPNVGPCNFNVYWEKTDFGYEVWQVEAVKSIVKKTQRDEWKKEQAAKVETGLKAFQKAHPYLFEVNNVEERKPISKLRAYLEKYPDGYRQQQMGLPLYKMEIRAPSRDETSFDERGTAEKDTGKFAIRGIETPEKRRFVIRRVRSGIEMPLETQLPSTAPIEWKPFEEVGLRRIPSGVPKTEPPLPKPEPPQTPDSSDCSLGQEPFVNESEFLEKLEEVLVDPYATESESRAASRRARESIRNLFTEEDEEISSSPPRGKGRPSQYQERRPSGKTGLQHKRLQLWK
ncbi:hypothetical protein QBC44DRAFT_333987 [Cladorrhinum sp. PSN332]|nr:hypothetical protein QBC44DRAFT_333987 [Cladorrhinum sp. PSN332]